MHSRICSGSAEPWPFHMCVLIKVCEAVTFDRPCYLYSCTNSLNNYLE